MNLSLKTKVMAIVAVVVLTTSSVSTFLSVSANKASIEQQVIERGIALAEALSRSVDEGLAMENLNLMKHVEDIVHTKDVILTQVFSSLWLGVAAVPYDQLNVPPSSAALEYFKSHKKEHDVFTTHDSSWADVYLPIFFDPHDARVPKMLIGYVRLRISTEEVGNAVSAAVFSNILSAVLLTILAILILNGIIGKYVLQPILHLHTSMTKHKEGDFPETVPVNTNDEIGELSAEFNEMSRSLREREATLAEEKERLAVTLRSIGDAVIVTDIEGRITLVNKVAEHHTGWIAREAIGRLLPEVFHIVNERTGEPCLNPVEKVIKSGLIVGLANHTVLIRKDSTTIAIEDSAAPIRDRNSVIVGIVLVFRDVTEKQKIEEELLKIEKLESIGLLAGGLAHDFNNILTAILGNISIAKMYIDPGHKAQARLTEAEMATRRATDLTYQLLTFSKGGAPVKQTTNIIDIIRESASFTLSGTHVAPEFVVNGDILNVDVDPGHMSQVFNNLIINAVQAMPNGGKIVFSASNVTLADHTDIPLHEGSYVKISVQDTGTGIPEEHLHKIFDPYFTTKQKGSGLGLTSVYSIIKRHDGHITLESKPGKGTTFHIYLPASKNMTIAKTAAAGTIAIGQGRVLVMDDEKLIRDICGEMLGAFGYEVAYALNGNEAIEQYQAALAAKKPFDAVIMDLTIPGGMGGKETIQKLRTIDPAVKAIVSSGYSNDPIMADYEKYGFKGVIIKPYDMGNFSKTLSEVMKGA